MYDADEFWGAPCSRPYQELFTDCCKAEEPIEMTTFEFHYWRAMGYV